MTKIIIVEDEPMISEIYQKKFSESGFEVLAVDSGDQVLALAKKEKIDVVLLDLIIPKMNGFEVLENLKSGKYDPNIKVIIFSNLSQKEDREKAQKLGADGFISKADYTPSALVKEVHRLFNQFTEEEKNERKNGKINGENGGLTESENSENHGIGKKILMIEDEEIFEEMFGGKLRQDGYEITFAKNGVWGMNEALKNNYDLLVIDMILPGMTGDEIVARLKMEEKTKNIPIIILSASVEEQAERKVREMGVNAFFVKTQLIPSELSKKVEEILSQ
jgi:DNA-binding response OmpR family regulator